MIRFFVHQRSASVSVSRCLFLLLVPVIGVLWTVPLCESEKREIWTSSYQRKDTLGWLIDSSFPHLPWPSLASLSPSPSLFPSPMDCWWARSPQTRRQPQPVRVLWDHLQPCKISPEAKGEQGRFCYSRCRRKKNVLLLDMSEIKSVWLAWQLWPFSMQTENVRIEWLECSYSQCRGQICSTVCV